MLPTRYVLNIKTQRKLKEADGKRDTILTLKKQAGMAILIKIDFRAKNIIK